jgi:large subunit ribosomal protein L9
MKVILKKDVPQVGRKFETKTVADGYARNFLLPNDLAEMATKKTIARLEMQKSLHEEQLALAEGELIKQLEKLEKATLTITEKANEQGHLFAGLHAEEIAKIITDQAKIEMHASYINLPKPIKELGEHTIAIKVGEQEASVTLVIEEDK